MRSVFAFGAYPTIIRFFRSGSYAYIQVWPSRFAGVFTLMAKTSRGIFLRTGPDFGIRSEKLWLCLEHDDPAPFKAACPWPGRPRPSRLLGFGISRSRVSTAIRKV